MAQNRLFSLIAGFGMVSAGSVAMTQAVLLLCAGMLNWPPVTANVTAVMSAALPAYYANRRWVWGRSDRHSFSREIAPFFGYALAGLVLSSVLVAVVARLWDSVLLVSAANLAGFGTLWVGKFFLCHRVLFARPDTKTSLRTADGPAA